ncbi:MAG TPA: hypothetical protein PK453_06310 [Leptospiraceae bacterium]|nr:hypothetical protein [Leptospiraceae bacterium]HMY66765.1 hypothetical protein [Leptospiraceae bacterium]HNF13266.1 hypothetical protein [Leptospiraceae bacterium]HNF25501.1 hypothetical protein [Leptospiraceae bacterium]HNI96277.1 hypothetical protein [Leptospiraceae bacterium]
MNVLYNRLFVFGLIVISAVICSMNSWFIFFPGKAALYFVFLSIPFLFLPEFRYRAVFSASAIFAGSVIFFILFYPVRNISLGDGELLYENFLLENSVWGYQLVLDEIFEAVLHSSVFQILKLSDPSEAYRILSTGAGLVLVLFLFFRADQKDRYSLLPILTSGGMLLFFGYMENYTLTALIIFLYAFTALHFLDRNLMNERNFLFLCLISALSFVFHMISGYLLFSLLCLLFHCMQKRRIPFLVLKAAVLGSLIISVCILYFILFSDLRIDFTDAHVTNPRFYPMKDFFSLNHFYEIVSCIFMTSLPSVSVTVYFIFFRREEWKSFYTSSQGRFLLFLLLGFLIHASVHNPQLGFPRDWDLMSFYWIPFSLIAYRLLLHSVIQRSELFPVFIFSLCILLSQGYYLNIQKNEDTEKLTFLRNSVSEFSAGFQSVKASVPPKERKFFTRASFFLFRTEKKLLTSEGREREKLLEKNSELKSLLSEYSGSWDRNLKIRFIRSATEFHHQYLQFVRP